jgi:hypothetical protein
MYRYENIYRTEIIKGRRRKRRRRRRRKRKRRRRRSG